ncbi:hypothetical protein HDE_07732 [Halotydeus destructor]|nr:hypothetical protein HDE_07732 [Halotydeus destructor]
MTNIPCPAREKPIIAMYNNVVNNDDGDRSCYRVLRIVLIVVLIFTVISQIAALSGTTYGNKLRDEDKSLMTLIGLSNIVIGVVGLIGLIKEHYPMTIGFAIASTIVSVIQATYLASTGGLSILVIVFSIIIVTLPYYVAYKMKEFQAYPSAV